MRDTITRWLEAFPDARGKRALRAPLEAIGDRYSSQALTSAGLVISSGGATTTKTGSATFYAVAQGVLVSVAGGTAMPALTGFSMTAGQSGVVCFFVDNGGNLSAVPGTPAASLGGVGWPQFPKGQALVGLLIITYASAFTGGTTPLDTATTVYVSPLGAFDPTVII